MIIKILFIKILLISFSQYSYAFFKENRKEFSNMAKNFDSRAGSVNKLSWQFRKAMTWHSYNNCALKKIDISKCEINKLNLSRIINRAKNNKVINNNSMYSTYYKFDELLNILSGVGKDISKNQEEFVNKSLDLKIKNYVLAISNEVIRYKHSSYKGSKYTGISFSPYFDWGITKSEGLVKKLIGFSNVTTKHQDATNYLYYLASHYLNGELANRDNINLEQVALWELVSGLLAVHINTNTGSDHFKKYLDRCNLSMVQGFSFKVCSEKNVIEISKLTNDPFYRDIQSLSSKREPKKYKRIKTKRKRKVKVK